MARLSADPKTAAPARAGEENLIALGHWAAMERDEGHEEVSAKDAEHLLRKLLQRRFGELSTEADARVAQASIQQLELWIERLFTIQSLEEVFVEQ